MELLELVPPHNLTFTIPHSTHRTLTMTNLTLRPLHVLLLSSHSELVLSHSEITMEAFQEIKVEILICWSGPQVNMAKGKIRIFAVEGDGEKTMWKMVQGQHQALIHQDIEVGITIDTKMVQMLNYTQKEELQYVQIDQSPLSHLYLLSLLFPTKVPVFDQSFHVELFQFPQALGRVKSIHPFPNSPSYLIEFAQVPKQDICEFFQHWIKESFVVYGIGRVIKWRGILRDMPSLVDVNSKEEIKSIPVSAKSININLKLAKDIKNKVQNKKQPEFIKMQPKKIEEQITKTKQQIIDKPQTTKIQKIQQKIQQGIQTQKIESNNTEEKEREIVLQNEETFAKKNSFHRPIPQFVPNVVQRHLSTKQSFMIPSTSTKKNKRRNKSEQKAKIEEEDEEEIDQEKHEEINFSNVLGKIDFQAYKEDLKNLRTAKNYQTKDLKQKNKEKSIQSDTLLETGGKILNVILDGDLLYLILRGSLKIYNLSKPLSALKIINFAAIDAQNVIKYRTPAILYRNETVIFANECYIYWVQLEGSSEWKYVQRKEIYGLAAIEELGVVAVGGKNFSKLAYFGKQTARSNIKMYSCSKHDHLYTYDIPGTAVGSVLSLQYLAVPPSNTKLLLAHTSSSPDHNVIYFLRVRAFDQVEIYGMFEAQQLGIAKLIRVGMNKSSNKIVAWERLGEVDCLKRLKIRSQYQKVQIITESIKLPLCPFLSVQIGGRVDSVVSPQWISLLEPDGRTFHLIQTNLNKLATYCVGNGEIRQVHWIEGRWIVMVSQGAVRVWDMGQPN